MSKAPNRKRETAWETARYWSKMTGIPAPLLLALWPIVYAVFLYDAWATRDDE